MQKLPEEIVIRIAQFLDRFTYVADQFDVPLHLRETPRSVLPPFATISRIWQRAIERRTFRTLRISSTSGDVADLEAMCVGRRRSCLVHLAYEVVLPGYDDEACARFERADERSGNDIAFTAAVKALFRVLKAWEDDSEVPLSGNLSLVIDKVYSVMDLSYRGLARIKEHQFQQAAGTRRDLFAARYRRSRVRLLDTEVLPTLRRVTRFEGSVQNDRNIAGRSFADICAKFPELEALRWTIDDDDKGYPQSRRLNRHECAASLARHKYDNLKDVNVNFYHEAPSNHDFVPADLVTPLTHDPLSTALRTLSMSRHLTSLTVEGVIDSTLFWPLDTYKADPIPQWPSLKRFDVTFNICTPSGSWYFSAAPHTTLPSENPPLHSPNRTEETDPNSDNESDSHDATADLHANGMLPVHTYRSTPNSETLPPLLRAMATAARHMPVLQRISLETYLDSVGSAWSVSYYAAGQENFQNGEEEDVGKRCVFWEVGGWRPDEGLRAAWRGVQEEGGVEFVEKFL